MKTTRTDLDEPLHQRAERPIRTRALRAVTILLASVVAACNAGGASLPPGSGPTIGPSSTTPTSPSSPALGASAPSPSSTSKGGVSAIIADGSGEVTPDYLDISALRVGSTSGQLTLSMDLAGAVPPGVPRVGLLAYTFSLDVDDDGAEDYVAALKLVPEGGFRPSLTDRRSGAILEGPGYPGAANLAGRTITLTIPVDALGCPPTVRVRAGSEGTTGGTTVRDRVPDAETAWIAVSTGCQPASD
ncbi:MAG: hypothetical protein ABJC39_02395 [Chloroflexota bacterium]